MKRTLSLTLVLGLITASALAATNVVSQNMVGYATVSATNTTVTGNLAMFGQPFVSVASTNDQTLSSIMGTNHGLNAYSDTFQLFDPQVGYVQFFWDGSQWVDDSLFTPADPAVPAGTGFWIVADRNNEYVFQGEVPTGDVTVSVKAGELTLCANPFPWGLDIQTDLTSTAPGPYSSTISLFDGTAYQQYYWDGTQWVDSSLVTPAVVTLIPGQGVWIQHPSDQDVTFVNSVN